MDARFTDLKVCAGIASAPGLYAGLMELADMRDLDSRASACGFKSRVRYHFSVNTDFESLNYHWLPSPTDMADNGDMWLAANAL